MKIKEISIPEQAALAYELIKELRPKLSQNDFETLSQEAKNRDDYKLVGLFEENVCLAIMGYRVLYDLVHGKHLYIDDLVVTAKRRSKGLGKLLLDFAEHQSQKLNCKTLRLCTSTENLDGIRFYQKNEWQQRAVVFKKTTSTN